MAPTAKKASTKKEKILLSDSSSRVEKGAFRDRSKTRSGAVAYVFNPRDNKSYDYGALEAPAEWPAKALHDIKVHPTGHSSYEPGKPLYFSVVVPSLCFMRFKREPLCATIGLEMDGEALPGNEPAPTRLLPLLPEDREADDLDLEDYTDALRDAVVDRVHHFIPECPSGGALALVSKIEVFLHNGAVKCLEMTDGALQRYHGLANRSAGKKYGPDMDSLQTGYYLPIVESDVSHSRPSKALLKFAREFRRDKNRRYVVRSAIYGGPFGYDPVAKTIHQDANRESQMMGPGTHLELRVTLAKDFSKALRSLEAGNPELTADDRRILWRRRPRVCIDGIHFDMEKQPFPMNSAFLRNMDAEFAAKGYRSYRTTEANELRVPVTERITEQVWPINLHQIGYPVYGILFFSTNDELEGTNGRTVNTTVWRFPPGLETLDVTYQNESLLPGGELTRLSAPEVDTADKLHNYDFQKRFRRKPGTYDQFYDDGVQKYLVVPLGNLYLQDGKLTELDSILVKTKFTNELSPVGWQMGFVSVTERQIRLLTTGEHIIVNSAGKQIQG